MVYRTENQQVNPHIYLNTHPINSIKIKSASSYLYVQFERTGETVYFCVMMVQRNSENICNFTYFFLYLFNSMTIWYFTVLFNLVNLSIIYQIERSSM